MAPIIADLRPGAHSDYCSHPGDADRDPGKPALFAVGSAVMDAFWKTKTLEEMTRDEWEISLRWLRSLLPAQVAA